MISPEEYMKRYKRCNNNSMFQKDEAFAHIINSLYMNHNMHFREIYSSTVYPQYIKLGDQHLFLWDNFYWDLLEAYIQCEILLSENKNNLELCIIYFTEMVYFFLTFRLEKYPYLSLAISEEAQIWRNQFLLRYRSDPDLQHIMKVSKASIKEQLLLCKLFVFLHEYTHFSYSISNDFMLDKENLIHFCKEMLPRVKAARSDKWLILSMEELAAGNDRRLLEETCCDLRAIDELTRIFNIAFDPKATTDRAYPYVLTHVEEVLRFQHFVMQIEQIWQSFYLAHFDNTGTINDVHNDWRNEFNRKRLKDQSLSAARFQFIHLASQSLPAFHTDASVKYQKETAFLKGYEREDYRDFVNTVLNYFCNEQALFALNARGLCLEYADKLYPQEALQKRDELLGWQ